MLAPAQCLSRRKPPPVQDLTKEICRTGGGLPPWLHCGSAINAVTRFARFLHASGENLQLTGIDRELLERYLAHLGTAVPGTRDRIMHVGQHVVQKILDHDSAQMTSHYARLSDKTVREHREKPARSVPKASPSRSGPTARLATRPGPGSSCRGPPSRSRTATASCRQSRAARMQIRA